MAYTSPNSTPPTLIVEKNNIPETQWPPMTSRKPNTHTHTPKIKSR